MYHANTPMNCAIVSEDMGVAGRTGCLNGADSAQRAIARAELRMLFAADLAFVNMPLLSATR